MRGAWFFQALTAAALLLPAGMALAQTSIVGAVHQGSVREGAIQWRSRVVFDALVAPETPVRAEFEAPVDPNRLSYPDGSVEPVLAGDRVTALLLRSNCGWASGAEARPTAATAHPIACTTDIYVVQPLARPRGEVHLQPPLLRGLPLQIVDVWGPEELMFIPSPAVGLERRLTAYTPAGVDKDLPRRWDQRLGFARRGPAHKPLYVQSTDKMSEGLSGTLASQHDRMRQGAIVVGISFVAIVTALIVAFLRLSRAARVERAERELCINLRRSSQLLNDTSTAATFAAWRRP